MVQVELVVEDLPKSKLIVVAVAIVVDPVDGVLHRGYELQGLLIGHEIALSGANCMGLDLLLLSMGLKRLTPDTPATEPKSMMRPLL